MTWTSHASRQAYARGRPHAIRLAATAFIGSALVLSAAEASAELIQHGNLRLEVNGQLEPKRLPRHGTAPVSVQIGAAVTTTDGATPPQLDRVTLDINRHGRLQDRGLDTCKPRQLAFSTTAEARRACADALVGRGHVSAEIALPDQAPLPSEGRLLAFNARMDGERVILGHVYGAEPLPVTLVVPFKIDRIRGTLGTRLTATFPRVAADWGYVTSFRMTIGRRYRAHGRKRSYLNAGCPAPKGFPGAVFTLARAAYTFDDGRRLTSSLDRSCKVKR